MWIALGEDEPWDDFRADLRTGIIASTIANYAGKMRGEGCEMAVPGDFMPYLEKPDHIILVDPDPFAFFGQF